jgi:hypothetical protein
LSVGFDGGQLSSDAGVLLLRGIGKRLGIVTRLASCLRDKRDPAPVMSEDTVLPFQWRSSIDK